MELTEITQEARLCACGQEIHTGTVMISKAFAGFHSGPSVLVVADRAEYIVRQVLTVPRRHLYLVAMDTVQMSHHVGEMVSWGYALGTVERCGIAAEIPASCTCGARHCDEQGMIRAAWESRQD